MKSRDTQNKPVNSEYDNDFYLRQVDDSLSSAKIVLAHLWKHHQADSVLDVGCGRGAWLKACHELGSTSLFGFDGDWNSQAQMIDSAIKFKQINLNKRFDIDQKVNLAISLEVAEHLDPKSSAQFVECLTAASDTVLFGAAYPGQGGVGHINEQPHSYWAKLFQRSGYAPFDLFRPTLWGDERVSFWYRQNTFLYVKKTSASYNNLIASGLTELANNSFMDCIHPELYAVKLNLIFSKWAKKKMIPGFVRAISKKIVHRKLNVKQS